MKRLASLVGTTALAAALLTPGKTSLATTTYAMYLQPISSTNVMTGPTSVFQFRALIDVPALDAANNATLTLTLGPAVTFDTIVTGPLPVQIAPGPANRSLFKFVKDASAFEPLIALGVTDPDALWDLSLGASFSTATNGTLTYQGSVAHTLQRNPGTNVPLLVPPGTYTIGTYTLPIRTLVAGSMDISLPGSLGLTGGRYSAQDFVNNTSTKGMTTLLNDGVLTYPNDGVAHFSTIHLTITKGNYAFINGRFALEGIDDLTKTKYYAQPNNSTIEFRAPGTTTVLYTYKIGLVPDPVNPKFSNYNLSFVTPGTYDIAIKDPKHLRVVVPNVTIKGSLSLPDVTLPGGDANNDNVVSIGDFGILINAYNTDYTTAGYDARADFNYDGVVDIADFGILVNNYNLSGAS